MSKPSAFTRALTNSPKPALGEGEEWRIITAVPAAVRERERERERQRWLCEGARARFFEDLVRDGGGKYRCSTGTLSLPEETLANISITFIPVQQQAAASERGLVNGVTPQGGGRGGEEGGCSRGRNSHR